MSSQLDVCVILATYNGEKYIVEQLDSLRNQTYPWVKVIISDDGSRDGTVKLVENYINEYSLKNWKLTVNAENKGYAKNFLEAACSANADIIFFCDQDDIWLPDKIELMVSVYQENSSVNMLASDLQLVYVDDDAVHWSDKDISTMNDSKETEFIKFSLPMFHCQRSGCTMSIRGDFLNDIIPYWVRGWAHDDFIWKCAVMLDCCAIFHYRGIKRRMHSNNVTNVKVRTRETRIEQIESEKKSIESLKKLVANVDKKDLMRSEKLAILNSFENYNSLRQQVVNKHSFIALTKLIFHYRNYYPTRNTMLMDMYLMIFKTYRK